MLLALWVPKLRGPSGDMLVHHLATLTLATLGAGYGYLEHLAPFFFGLTELSSVRDSVAPAASGVTGLSPPPLLARRSRSLSWTSSSSTQP